MRSVRSFLVFASALLALAAPTAAHAVTPAELDTSFGAGGVASSGIQTDSTGLITAQSQPDGKTVVFYRVQGTSNSTLTRFNQDGSIDASFGTAGSAAVGPPADTVYPAKVLIASDGTIYACGSTPASGKFSPAIWAFTPGGAPKSSFDADGLRTFPGADVSYLLDAELSAAGDVVYLARNEANPDHQIVLRFVTPGGGLGAGTVFTNTGIDLSPLELAIGSNGRILVTAALGGFGSDPAKVFAFNAGLGIDGGFGSGGSQTVGITGSPALPYAMDFIDGLLMVGGAQLSGAIVTSYDAGGNPLATAGPNGTNRFTPLSAASSYVLDIAPAAGGRIYATGDTYLTGGARGPGFLARFNRDGTLDATMATGGIEAIGGGAFAPFRLLPQSDGKIKIVGAETGTRVLTIRRVWGDAQPPVVATAAFAKSVKSKSKAKKFKTIKGTATGTAVTKVEVAIQRVDSKLLKKKKRCVYVKSTKGSTKTVKAIKRKCVASVWIRASGTAAWSLKLKKPLRPGKYVLSARATGTAGIGPVSSKRITLTK